MITDDMIRANLERVARERSGSRSILGFPVIERDFLEDEQRDAISHAVEVSKSASSGTLTVIGTFSVTRELLEDETRRIEAESNQRAIDASRAELREILNGRH